MPESDETLLKKWQQGDLDAFQIFYRRHIGKVSGYVQKKGLPKDDVPEVVQESFLKLHLHIAQYEPEKRALAWFFSIVHNTCIDALKRGGKINKMCRPVSLDTLELAIESQEILSNEVEFDAAAALGTLKPEQRTLLDMRLLNEMSFDQMAASTGKSAVSLRKSYSRAMQALRDLVNKRNL